MAKFYLIQRGTFKTTGEKLTGTNGVVNLDCMEATEFEWGAIPNAYRRLMYHYSEYETVPTGIYTPEHDELMVFCRKDCKEKVLEAILSFIKQSYSLKKYSELEKVPTAKKGDKTFTGRRTNFWWCIDTNGIGDWMAFLASSKPLFDKGITCDYESLWLKKTPEEREADYKKALRW
jgi:hypothetical protein